MNIAAMLFFACAWENARQSCTSHICEKEFRGESELVAGDVCLLDGLVLVMVSQSFQNLLNLAVSAAERPTWHGRLLQRLSAGEKCKRRLSTWCCSRVGRWGVDDGK